MYIMVMDLKPLPVQLLHSVLLDHSAQTADLDFPAHARSVGPDGTRRVKELRHAAFVQLGLIGVAQDSLQVLLHAIFAPLGSMELATVLPQFKRVCLAQLG